MAKQDYTPSMTMIKLDFIAKELHHLVQNDSRGEGIVASLVKVATDVATAGICISDLDQACDKVSEILHRDDNAAALTQTIRVCEAIIKSSEPNTSDWALAHRPLAVAKYMVTVLDIPEKSFSNESKQHEVDDLINDNA